MDARVFGRHILPLILALVATPCRADESSRLLSAMRKLNSDEAPVRCADDAAGLESVDCSFVHLVGKVPADKSGQSGGLTLESAWSATTPVSGSPYAKYYNLDFLRVGPVVKKCFSSIGYRYSDGDRCSVEHLNERRAAFGPGVAVMMSSGGAHSIAMAAELVRDGGYQPIWKMGSQVAPEAVTATEQDVAAFRYHYPDFAKAKPASDAPPVLIMDQHRGDPKVEGDFDNRAEFDSSQYPSAKEYLSNGIRKLIWVVEYRTDKAPVRLDEAALEALAVGKGGKYERYHDDPIATLRAYVRAGLEVYILRISPYDCPYSKRR